MTIHRTSLILPCQSLEDFPTYLRGIEAIEILTAWTSLWHPALLATTGSLPHWHQADDPPKPDDLEGEFVVVPSVSRKKLPCDWCEELQATAPRNFPPVTEIGNRQGLMTIALDAAGQASTRITESVVQDFLALGYAYLQVELLTHAMRYSSVIDAEDFRETVVKAAREAVAGNDESACEGITRAVDLLTQARSHYYAVDFYLVDVTLLSPTTLGKPLQEELAKGHPTSLLATGELIEQIATTQPETWSELTRAMEADKACIIGGTMSEAELNLLSPEALLQEIQQARQVYQKRLGSEIQLFAQYRSSFSPLLPQVLHGCGFHGALHASFDGGPLPKSEQCKTQWGDWENGQIDTLAATPLDSGQAGTILALSEQISHSMDYDHVATVILAGWPGHRSEFYDDLRRISRYGPVLGQFVTLEQYFEVPTNTYQDSTFHSDKYPSLVSAPPSNPISTLVSQYQEQIKEVHTKLLTGLTDVMDITCNNDESSSGLLAINPWNFSCCAYSKDVTLPIERRSPKESDEPSLPNEPWLRPNVPGCGYARIDQSADSPPVPLAEGIELRNEWLEATISQETGGIQALRSYHHRGNRVSQRLVFCNQPKGSREPLPSHMVAESVEITRQDAVVGEITSRGQLVGPDGNVLARYTQAVRLPRASRTLWIDLELELETRPEGDRWFSYFASRLAWRDEAPSLRRGMGWTGRPTQTQRITSPEWVEIADATGTITLFPLGLPWHRRISSSQLDTLLVVEKEQQRRFQLAIGLDCPYPTQTSLALLTEGGPSVTKSHSRLDSNHGWFLHLSAKNVIMTYLERLEDNQKGIVLRLLETEGRAVQAKLSAFRPFHSGELTDFQGRSQEVLSVEEGKLILNIRPHQWLQLEAAW